MVLAIDGSSPAVATGAGPSVTSASFTPPTNSLLVIEWSGDSGTGQDPSAPTITDNLGGHLTYTLWDWQSHIDSPARNGQSAQWTAPVLSSAAMTISITNNASATTGAFKVYVVTDSNGGLPVVGAHGKSGSTSAASIAQNYTAAAGGGWGFLGYQDNTAAVTSGSGGTGCTVDASGVANSSIAYGFGRRTTADDVNGVTNTINITLSTTSTELTWTYIEILQPTGTFGFKVVPEQIPPYLIYLLALRQTSTFNVTTTAVDQTVTPNGITSSEQLGTPSVIFSINPSGIPSSEQLGNAAVTTTYTINANGISSAEVLGSATVAISVSPSGITSNEQLGNATITTTYTINANGIPSSERLGNNTITSTYTINANGITSNELLGAPTVIQAISPSGIISGEQLGNATITTTYTINANGIITNEAVGNANVQTATSITPSGIVSGERVGAPTITTTYTINANGIPSSEQFGNNQVVLNVAAGGIVSAERLGSPSLTVVVGINPSGIPSSEQLGSPTVTATYTISANGIISAERIGSAQVSATAQINAGGIGSAEALGAAALVPGSVTIQASGIVSSEALGRTQVSIGFISQVIQAVGIRSDEKFGAPFVGPPMLVDVAGRVGFPMIIAIVENKPIRATDSTMTDEAIDAEV